jgi:hypothetical protein
MAAIVAERSLVEAGRPRWWRRHVQWTERTGTRRDPWVRAWPSLADQGAPLLVLAALTAVLAWLAVVRLQPATSAAACMQGNAPRTHYVLCSQPEWNPHALGMPRRSLVSCCAG